MRADGALLSGMYAHVSFDVKRQDQPVFVPATSVIFDALGTRAAVIDRGVVRWAKVAVESDLGDKLAIATGVQAGELVAINPSEHLVEGVHVDADERNADGTPLAGHEAAPDAPEIRPATGSSQTDTRRHAP